MLSSSTTRGELVTALVSTIRGEKITGDCQANLSGVRQEIEYSVCTTTTAIPALASSGNSSSKIHDHFRADFDRRFRRLLAGTVVVEVSAAIMENFGRLAAALLATLVAELLLRWLLAGPVATDTGGAVIENCEARYRFRMTQVAETCFDQITTVVRLPSPLDEPYKMAAQIRLFRVRQMDWGRKLGAVLPQSNSLIVPQPILSAVLAAVSDSYRQLWNESSVLRDQKKSSVSRICRPINPYKWPPYVEMIGDLTRFR